MFQNRRYKEKLTRREINNSIARKELTKNDSYSSSMTSASSVKEDKLELKQDIVPNQIMAIQSTSPTDCFVSF